MVLTERSAVEKSTKSPIILVIDDEQAILLMLQEILEDEGYTVHVAGNGKAGLSCARTVHPDLILTDLMMPVMDGYALGRHLRAEPSTAAIPLIVMSAFYKPQPDVAFDAVITKPFDILPVLDLIDAHLGDES